MYGFSFNNQHSTSFSAAADEPYVSHMTVLSLVVGECGGRALLMRSGSHEAEAVLRLKTNGLKAKPVTVQKSEPRRRQ